MSCRIVTRIYIEKGKEQIKKVGGSLSKYNNDTSFEEARDKAWDEIARDHHRKLLLDFSW